MLLQSWVPIVLNLAVHVVMCKIIPGNHSPCVLYTNARHRLLLLCYSRRSKNLVEEIPHDDANHAIRHRSLCGLLCKHVSCSSQSESFQISNCCSLLFCSQTLPSFLPPCHLFGILNRLRLLRLNIHERHPSSTRKLCWHRSCRVIRLCLAH